MRLEGSCQCAAVTFKVETQQPVPYQRCYCSICRKLQGGGGYAINLSADFRTLKVRGSDKITAYHAKFREPGQRAKRSGAERTFCSVCGTGLWLYDKRWPDLVHPYVSTIDTDLPVPPEHTHLMLDFKPGWVEVEKHRRDKTFGEYPEESIAEWHERTGMTAD